MYIHGASERYQSIIFSGFQVDWNTFHKLSQTIDFSGPEADYVILKEYYVGKILIHKTDNFRGAMDFSLDLLRDYSTCEEVRNIRFTLMKIDEEKYGNVYPKLFLIDL